MKPMTAATLMTPRKNSTVDRDLLARKPSPSVESEERTFTVSSHTEELDHAEKEEENRDPYSNVDLLPKGNCDTGGSNFEGQNGQPSYCIIPAHGEAPADVCY